MTRRVLVTHDAYGCDTGCCGHIVSVEMDGIEIGHRFSFDHPWGVDARKFAESLVREEFGDDHVADLSWDDCLVVDDA